MYIPNRIPPLSRDYGTLLNGQLPTLTARPVGTVVRTATTDKELTVGGDMDVRLVGTVCDILKGWWAEGAMSVDALRERKREKNIMNYSGTLKR